MKSFARFSAYAFTIAFCLSFFLVNAQERKRPKKPSGDKQYTIEQATSERAQLHTAAFSGLAFITGKLGADTFFPPGKVADFFGFQYMRDNDNNEMGHNTDFLTRIASNVIAILTPDQLQQFKVLANEQAPIYDAFANKRIVLISAFRADLDDRMPGGKTELSREAVVKFCADLYRLDAELSYNRALVVGKIICSFNAEQKAALAKLEFSNSATWPKIAENLDKRSLSHRAHVGVMTYASELFSWYAGSVTADVYFCPERHGTYFGGFYLKDYPAMGNPDYFISTALTGDKGKDFITTLTPEQAELLTKAMEKQAPMLKEIVLLRTAVAQELRRALNGEIPNKEKVFNLISRYGELDGGLSYEYARCFAQIRKSLSTSQVEQLKAIRNLDVFPKGAYLFSDPIPMPEVISIDSLFK